MKPKICFSNFKRGFTIIELIITIFILSIAIIGVFGAFSTMVVLTSNISDNLIAVYLAQEGVEIIRNIRDTNWINMDMEDSDTNPVSWNSGLSTDDKIKTYCQVDYTTTGSGSNRVLSWNENSYLKRNQDNFYGYGEGEKTKFKRKITIEHLGDDNDILKVIVEVFWDEKPNILNPFGKPGNIKVEEVLYDWY